MIDPTRARLEDFFLPFLASNRLKISLPIEPSLLKILTAQYSQCGNNVTKLYA